MTSQKIEKIKNHLENIMAYLIDTNIIIYSLKNDENVQQKFMEHERIPKYISIITYGELLYGAKRAP
jgi:tRNA(fMet)-specific endonuclease VapC